MANELLKLLTRLGIAFAVITLLLVAYVLSFGPTLAMIDRGYISKESHSAMYAPLAPLVHRSKRFANFIVWYQDFWLSGEECGP